MKICSHVIKFSLSSTFVPILFCNREYNFSANGSHKRNEKGPCTLRQNNIGPSIGDGLNFVACE